MGRENTYGEIIDVLKLPKDMVVDMETMGGVFGGEFWEESMSVLATCFSIIRDSNLTYSRLLETIDKIDNEAKSESERHLSLQELCKKKGFNLSTYMSGKALASLRLAISYDENEVGIAWQMLCSASFYTGGALSYDSNDNPKLSGRNGGLQAAENRAHIRKQVKHKVKDAIQKQFIWNDARQTGKSITDRLWSEIKNAIDGGNEWQGISNSDLLQGKIGRQTVYDAVMETAPR